MKTTTNCQCSTGWVVCRFVVITAFISTSHLFVGVLAKVFPVPSFQPSASSYPSSSPSSPPSFRPSASSYPSSSPSSPPSFQPSASSYPSSSPSSPPSFQPSASSYPSSSPSSPPSFRPSASSYPSSSPSSPPSFQPSTSSSPTTTCKSGASTTVEMDIMEIRDKVKQETAAFIVMYTHGLGQIDCNSTPDVEACKAEVLTQMEYMDGYCDLSTQAIAEIDLAMCLQENFGGEGADPIRFVEPAPRPFPTGRRLTTDGAPDLALDLFPYDEAIIGLKAVKIAVTAASSILLALPECGGCFTGGICALATSSAKLGLTASFAIAAGLLDAALLVITEVDAINKKYSFQYSVETYKNLQSVIHQLIKLQTDIDNIIETVDKIEKEVVKNGGKLDKLLCPFKDVEKPLFVVLGQGCDGVNQDCDEFVDECDEDRVPPSIRLKVAKPLTPFKTKEDARYFLEHNIEVTDDCAAPDNLSFTVVKIVTECVDCKFEVIAKDERCFHKEATATATFTLMVDNTPPKISCGFYTPQDAKYVSEDFDACLGISPPFPALRDQLHIDAQNFRQKFVDVQLWFDIKTSPTDTKIDVDVRVLSNEFEGRPPIDDKMASILKRVDLPNIVNRVNLFIAPVSCQDGRPGASTICKAEEAMGITTRFYDIEITGTDRAGNVGTTTCSIIVVPHMPATITGKGKGKGKGNNNNNNNNNNKQPKLKGVLKMNPKKNKSKSGGIIQEPQPHDPNALREQFDLSTQRFEISTVSFVWDSDLNTTLAVPPPPTVEHVHGSFPGCVQNQLKKDEALLPPPPTPSLSRSPPRMIPWMANEDGIVGPNPKIEVDRLCYDTVGENLVVTYNLFLEKQQDLSSVTTDITIQVYDMNNIEIVFENIILNPRVENNPLLSSLSCGIETCHTWTSRGGLQMSTTNLIGNGHDYGVLLLAKTTTDDDANNINDNSRLEILAGVSFRLGGCNE